MQLLFILNDDVIVMIVNHEHVTLSGLHMGQASQALILICTYALVCVINPIGQVKDPFMYSK